MLGREALRYGGCASLSHRRSTFSAGSRLHMPQKDRVRIEGNVLVVAISVPIHGACAKTRWDLGIHYTVAPHMRYILETQRHLSKHAWEVWMSAAAVFYTAQKG